MDSTTLPSKPSLTTEGENLQMVFSLYEALQELPDERRAQGKRYSLALIVCLLILAKLAGQKSVRGATQWLRHRRVALAARFGLYWSRLPCHMTYCNVLVKVDGAYLDKIVSAFFEWWEAQSRGARGMRRLLTPEGYADHSHLAIDGKVLRATSKHEHPVHQLSCYEVTIGGVLWHCNVQEKHNEISELKPDFPTQWVKGRILSLDALHTRAWVVSPSPPSGRRPCADCQRQPAHATRRYR